MTRTARAIADLFADEVVSAHEGSAREQLGAQAWVLRGFGNEAAETLLRTLEQVIAAAPLRHMQVPGGHLMSVAMSNCGSQGWSSDVHGYRYSAFDPISRRPWPAMPPRLRALAAEAAREAGFDGYDPDACLINEYRPGARMGLHQDRDEQDRASPIVSLSLGLDATFQFGGLSRRERPQRVTLSHGDVVVWGGVDRLRYHGVLTLRGGHHPLLGERRINCTFRRTGLDCRP